MKTEKRRLYEARYRAENKDKLNEAQRRYYKKNAARIKTRQAIHGKARRLRTYGITAAQEQELLTSQNKRCAICRSTSPNGNGKQTWLIDHDHSQGIVRGLLCLHCNLILGHAKDHIDILQSAIKYLQKHQKASKLKVEKEKA